ncbi:CPBP family intramembrane metalloprotease [Patescibacteria group bacterium]|nr:CPBP family intramembrane metalloprotease [Patescibacteria group bacterium]
MKIDKNRELTELIAFGVFFYIIPLALLSFGYIPFEGRHIILFLMGIILVAYSIQKKIKAHKLGFRVDNLKNSLLVNFIVSIVLLLVMYVAYITGILRSVNYEGTFLFLIFYIFISVPIQEFIFRSLMFYEISIFTKNRVAIIGFSTLIYSFSHIMYHSLQVMVITSIVGVIWGLIYLRWPNYWGVTLSHILVGAAAVFVGIA